MVVGPALLHLALLPALALSSSVAARGKSQNFYDSISLREVGARNTLDWRIWLEKNGNPISFWHDIPLYPNENNKQIINCYVEIPRWTDAKIETKRSEPLNPIFHDDKKKSPRFVYSVWPHKSYPFHYGSIPQTWESPNFEHELTGLIGDNDPIDIFDISEKPAYTGQIKQVKILGGLAMVDDETTDWKVIAIDVTDPLADLVDDVSELEKYRPGLAQEFYDWFIYYKVVKGDGLNTITGNKYQSAKFVTKTVKKSHGYWKDLARGKVDSNEINYNQTSDKGWKKSYVDSSKATKLFDIPKTSNVLPAAARPAEYDLWYYLDSDFSLIEL
ncbi:inorganic pyrophosphatase [Thelonectria olida]|uniref:inorganic diphosphatase n=1 Tax=Thelonectria olida TaxID=1576542 RepID=A0A9P8VUZ6_9HYPO|nr:inorganic pyrophosphatase [Thelonectria olida]